MNACLEGEGAGKGRQVCPSQKAGEHIRVKE